MGKLAQQVGTSVENLSRLEYAGRLADVSLADLKTSAGQFSEWLRKTGQDSQDLAQALLERLIGVGQVGRCD